MERFNFLILVVIFLFISSCDEDEWLRENPLDMFTAENAFVQPSDFESGVARIYRTVSNDIWQGNQNYPAVWYTGTDIGLRNGDGAYDREFNDYSNLIPTMGYVSMLWNLGYNIISASNSIISRIDDENIEFDSETSRKQLKANAMFFRAFGYRLLVHIYGGVPLILEETTSAKRDYERATKEAVVAQIISDLEYAADNLPTVSERKADGWLHKAVAYHLLAEIYNTTGELDKAIAAASWVIDNPNFALMTERFGSRSDEPGDVYWDLFRRNNQNRSRGNTEALWVSQYEYQVIGGGNSNQLERFAGPQYWLILGPDGNGLFIGPTSHNGGRGISWTGLNNYGDTLIWESDWDNDIRNSEYNILRDMVADNPNSDYFGEKVIENNLVAHKYFGMETWNSTYVKNTPINNQPDESYLDKSTGLLSRAGCGRSFTDVYIFRLAETYLLRAEAYLLKGQTDLAANDINEVRKRANASLVDPADVDIDYILDERARELIWEELRRLTLQRTGKLVERVRKYNRLAKNTIQDHHSLWPIPFSEIEKNIGVPLEQNPGY